MMKLYTCDTNTEACAVLGDLSTGELPAHHVDVVINHDSPYWAYAQSSKDARQTREHITDSVIECRAPKLPCSSIRRIDVSNFPDEDNNPLHIVVQYDADCFESFSVPDLSCLYSLVLNRDIIQMTNHARSLPTVLPELQVSVNASLIESELRLDRDTQENLMSSFFEDLEGEKFIDLEQVHVEPEDEWDEDDPRFVSVHIFDDAVPYSSALEQLLEWRLRHCFVLEAAALEENRSKESAGRGVISLSNTDKHGIILIVFPDLVQLQETFHLGSAVEVKRKLHGFITDTFPEYPIIYQHPAKALPKDFPCALDVYTPPGCTPFAVDHAKHMKELFLFKFRSLMHSCRTK